MKYTSKKLPQSQVEIKVNFTIEEFSPLYNEIFEQHLKNVEIKGFRKGQAPKEMAQQAINPEAVFEEVARRFIRQSLDEITTENDWTIIEQPKIEVIEPSAGIPKDFSYKAVLTLFPQIK